MTISFADRVKVPDDILISTLQSESVILNLNSESYFGLDEVGTHILSILSTSNSIQAAYDVLLDEYEVDAEVLRQDLASLIERLAEQGVVVITRADVTAD